MDLYSIGEMVIDFTPGIEPGSFIRNAGGAPANVAIAVRNNGLEAMMCCSVGDDDFGKFLYKTLEKYDIGIANPEFCRQAITTMAFVDIDENGDRSFIFARKPGADMFLSEASVKDEDIADSKIINAGSCSLSASPAREATIKAMQLAHSKGKIVAFDLNYREPMWNGDINSCLKTVDSVLPYVDFFKLSEEEAEYYGDDQALFALMKKNRITVIIKTLGSEGVDYYFNGCKYHRDGIKVKAVDTTAAGDAFWGTFLACIIKTKITNAQSLTVEFLQNAVAYGNVAGSLCVQRKGAIAALPDLAEIERNLAKMTSN